MEEKWLLVEINDRILYAYQVSNFGNIRKTETKELMRLYTKPEGYKVIDLMVQGKRKKFHVHRLVAKAFIPELDNSLLVNHKDGNKKNNHVDNLEWVTASENMRHARMNREYKEPIILTEREKQFVVNACEIDLLTRLEISNIFGISLRMISKIKNEWRKEKASDTPASKV